MRTFLFIYWITFFIYSDSRIRFNDKTFGELSPYLKEYVEYSKRYDVYDENNFLKLKFIKITDNNENFKDTPEVMGVCLTYSSPLLPFVINKVEIYINKRYYEELKDTEDLRRLVFHELGHCIHYVDHVENDSNDLMYPYIASTNKQELDLIIKKFFLQLAINKYYNNKQVL